ncbi:MAG TPA: DedA family protein [Oxalicibacterium sp.]|nr:DedA family protein [Oxalicibacterium sp.]
MFDFIVDIMAEGGYIGIFFLMLMENVFPPIPSELIMSLAGYVAADGELNIVWVILAGTAGSVAGALFWYYAGLLFGRQRIDRLAERHGRWLTVSPAEIDAATRWFGRHGRTVLIFGRLVPAVRTLISVPPGILRMPLAPFLIYSTIGSILWNGLLAMAGYLLKSQYAMVEQYADPITKGVLVLLVAVYLYRVIRFKPQTE